MDPMNLASITGTIQTIRSVGGQCDNQRAALITNDGPANIDINPSTYVADQTRLTRGMTITAFYDMTRPMPLIYPPQYQAVAVAAHRGNETVIIRFFNTNLTASDNSLRLNLAPTTRIVTANGQTFTCRPGNRTLMVFYDRTTRSIPPQTTPRKIIVF